ncbi:hypothetical protein SAMN04487949_3452 [Halogranum gelatinilyticum]|uniref:ThuA-like domain-containing protein n=1 Tax=Halogranum gelatinilyticum TaxID=660521 RepID=A0A1G9YYY5_9EURY|nr:ThuA domain-containing protein [Halogranum gelatinilyticum]SDN13925.1 hypothetical protein SAMN04487949_3452 [Halogranum gelatinilyticum]
MSPTPTVLVIGENSFPFHSLDARREAFEEIFAPVADVELTTDRERLTDLSSVDVVVDYLTDSTLSEPQLASLEAFLDGGGGYLPVHCGADLMSVAPANPEDVLDTREEPFPELRTIIGGHFLTHPKETEFGVTVTADHPVTDGVDDFRVFDEPYQVAWDDDVTVLATMDHPDLESYPVLWVKQYGAGRVCYCSLGHTDDALGHESVQRLLRNAVDWLSTSTN